MAEILGFVAFGIQGAELVKKLIKFCDEVKHLKERCGELMEDVVLVHGMLDQRRGSLEGLPDDFATRLRASLEDAWMFLVECRRDWNIFLDAFEVAFRKRHKLVAQSLQSCKADLVADTVVGAPFPWRVSRPECVN